MSMKTDHWYERPALALSADAQAHSRRVVEQVNEAIRMAGGWLDFSRFMALVLYAPGLGYYAAGATKLGAAGDFVTAPEMTPLFARILANPLARALRAVPPHHATVLELGAGSGQLAHDLLLALQEREALPERYLILEVSPDLRLRQERAVACLPEVLRQRVHWCDHWPATLTGVMVANEVLDALPVQRLRWTQGQWWQWGVSLVAGGWQWGCRPLTDATLLVELPAMEGFPDPYDTEVAPLVDGLMATLAASLKAGQAFLIDYGFPAREYYHPQRSGGTLMCHYRHHAHGDPFLFPGMQDITAHVDFTRVARSARRHGLKLEGWSSQAQWLVDEGITEELNALHAQEVTDYAALSAVQKLLSPAEMGELFKVMVLGHGEESTSALGVLGL